MKKFLTFLLIALVPLLFGGCYDRAEIGKTAYAAALGFDTANEGLICTFQMVLPENLGEEEGGGVKNISVGCTSLAHGKSKLCEFLGKELSFAHLKLVVFSEETAENGIKEHIVSLLNEREAGVGISVGISKGSAADFLSGTASDFEPNTAEYYTYFSEKGGSFSPFVSLAELENRQKLSGGAVPCGIFQDSKSRFSGLFLLKDYKLCGSLGVNQSRLFSLIGGKTEEKLFGFESGSLGFAAFEVKKPCRLSVREENGSLFLVCKGELAFDGDKASAKALEGEISKEAAQLFEYLKSCDCDALGALDLLRKRYGTFSELDMAKGEKPLKTLKFLSEIKVTPINGEGEK